MEDGSSSNSYLPFPKGFATKAIHAGHPPEQWKSIVLSSTFKLQENFDNCKYKYSRLNNPTREVLELCLAELDGAKHGLVFGSGLGAFTTLFGMLDAGDHIICNDDIYGGTHRFLTKVIPKHGISTSFLDARFLDVVEAAITPNTKLIWIETPTNPNLKVIDIAAVSRIAKAHKLLVVVDNTFLTPFLQRPLDFGADIVIYSLTKYVNGHSDVLMGAIVTSNDEVYEKLKFFQGSMGTIPSSFDCYQVSRGLKTLALRMRQHSQNALKIAQFLEKHPKVEKVLHPGLPSHPQSQLYKKQTSGHCGIVTFLIKNSNIQQTKKVLSNLKVFAFAGSLGGYESLAGAPFIMTHAALPPDQKKQFEITENMIRLSVGIEDEEDLIQDLKSALDVI